MPDELTAGPAGDALVGEAMGWTHLKWEDIPMRCYPPKTVRMCFGVPPGESREEAVPEYTTTGDGMLAMLEWMDAKGWFWKVENSPCGCTVYPSPGTHTPYIIAGTAPLAVAKALLAAVAATEEPTT